MVISLYCCQIKQLIVKNDFSLSLRLFCFSKWDLFALVSELIVWSVSALLTSCSARSIWSKSPQACSFQIDTSILFAFWNPPTLLVLLHSNRISRVFCLSARHVAVQQAAGCKLRQSTGLLWRCSCLTSQCEIGSGCLIYLLSMSADSCAVPWPASLFGSFSWRTQLQYCWIGASFLYCQDLLFIVPRMSWILAADKLVDLFAGLQALFQFQFVGLWACFVNWDQNNGRHICCARIDHHSYFDFDDVADWWAPVE